MVWFGVPLAPIPPQASVKSHDDVEVRNEAPVRASLSGGQTAETLPHTSLKSHAISAGQQWVPAFAIMHDKNRRSWLSYPPQYSIETESEGGISLQISRLRFNRTYWQSHFWPIQKKTQQGAGLTDRICRRPQTHRAFSSPPVSRPRNDCSSIGFSSFGGSGHP